jgi:hypothetical protein
LWRRLSQHFGNAGFTTPTPRPIVNPTGETLFTSAALQVIDPVVHEGAPRHEEPMIVAQPVIRLNSTDAVGLPEGFSTSFVNIGTEQVVRTFDAFGAHLGAWLAGLRSVGLEHSRLCLIAEPVRFRGGRYEGWYLVLDHGGIEMGEAIAIDTVRGHPGMKVLDFGFGLERILWAVNGTPTYYDSIGPLSERLEGHVALVDAARTAMLMAMTGIEPGHRSHGYRMRQAVGRLADQVDGFDVPERVLLHSYDYWSSFLVPTVPPAESLHVIGLELMRRTNLRLCRDLGIEPPAGSTTSPPDSFIEHLLTRGITYGELLSARQGAAHGGRAHR